MKSDTNSSSRIARFLSLRRTELVALASTALAFLLTVAAVVSTPLEEANPVVLGITELLIWAGAGVLGFVAFRLFRAVDVSRSVSSRAAPAVVALLMVTSMFAGVVVIGTQPVTESQSGTATAAAGDELWASELGARPWESSPTISNGMVYIGAEENELHAFDSETGDLEWTAPTGGITYASSPTVANGMVFIGDGGGSLHAFDAETGDEVWDSSIGSEAFSSSPTVKDGTVYIGSGDGSLYAFDIETGDEQWNTTVGSDVKTSPTVKDGSVYFGSDDNNVYAVDADTGEQEWSFGTGDDVTSSATVKDGTVFIASNDDKMYAIDAETGDEKWSSSVGSNVYSSPTVKDGIVYIGSYDNNLYAFDTQTGDEEWTFSTGGNVHSAPTVANGTVYFGAWDNTFYAVDAKTGTEEWSTGLGDITGSSPTVANGVVYIGSDDGNLYAFDTDHSGTSSGTRNELHTLGHVGEVGAGGSTAAEINGTVTDPTGDGYGAATVELVNESETVTNRVTPAANGSYEISGVRSGNYTLRVKSDEYDTVSRSVSVSGSPVTVDVELGYRQTVELNDPRGIFKPYDPEVTVYRWDGAQLTTRSPTESTEWTRTQTRTMSWDGDLELGLADGEFYAFVLEVDHSPEANGSAQATLFGFVGDPANGTLVWDVSEPETDSNSAVVATKSGDAVRVVYDGPSVEELNYTLRDGNSTVERNLSFDEPRSYYDGQIRLGNHTGNFSDPESVSYLGLYGNGSSFNGTSEFEASTLSFGPVSSGGGSGPPISPVLVTTGLAAAGFLIYSRQSGRSLGELSSDAAEAARSVLGRGDG